VSVKKTQAVEGTIEAIFYSASLPGIYGGDVLTNQSVTAYRYGDSGDPQTWTLANLFSKSGGVWALSYTAAEAASTNLKYGIVYVTADEIEPFEIEIEFTPSGSLRPGKARGPYAGPRNVARVTTFSESVDLDKMYSYPGPSLIDIPGFYKYLAPVSSLEFQGLHTPLHPLYDGGSILFRLGFFVGETAVEESIEFDLGFNFYANGDFFAVGPSSNGFTLELSDTVNTICWTDEVTISISGTPASDAWLNGFLQADSYEFSSSLFLYQARFTYGILL
jgi:hypothetical protein